MEMLTESSQTTWKERQPAEGQAGGRRNPLDTLARRAGLPVGRAPTSRLETSMSTAKLAVWLHWQVT